MFVRMKGVKKKNGALYEYAHLVHGIWRRRRVQVSDSGEKQLRPYRNSVHKYAQFLGRVYRFHEVREISTLDSFCGGSFSNFVATATPEQIYTRLLAHTLLTQGFRQYHHVFLYGSLVVDLSRKLVHDGNQDIVLKLQQRSGYLCSYTLEQLFQIQSIRNRIEGVTLLRALQSVGIVLSSDHFFCLADRFLQLSMS